MSYLNELLSFLTKEEPENHTHIFGNEIVTHSHGRVGEHTHERLPGVFYIPPADKEYTVDPVARASTMRERPMSPEEVVPGGAYSKLKVSPYKYESAEEGPRPSDVVRRIK